jgi:hypothetical protein
MLVPVMTDDEVCRDSLNCQAKLIVQRNLWGTPSREPGWLVSWQKLVAQKTLPPKTCPMPRRP